MKPIYHTDPPEKLREVPAVPAKAHHPGKTRDILLSLAFFAAFALLVWGCVQVYLHPEEHYPALRVERAPVSSAGDPVDEPGKEPGEESSGGSQGGAVWAVSHPAASQGKTGGEVEGAGNIVASFGEHELTNQTFQYYYWDCFYSLFDYYGSYLANYMDFTKPFDQQQATETQTWHEYICDMAIQSWSQTVLLIRQGEREGFVLDAEDMEYITAAEESLDSHAKEGGYADGEDYLQFMFDPSSDRESYFDYQKSSLYARSFAQSRYQQFYDENYDPDSEVIHNINVRHILLKPQEGESDEALKARAEELYQLWQQDPTEEYFSQLAGERTEDFGSQASGGLYEDVYPGQMVVEFNDWCFDPARQAGDSGLVRTDYGYHIMYFAGQSESVYSDPNEDRALDLYNGWLDDLFAAADPEIHLENAVFTTKEAAE